jgi:hypothetical protein
MPSVDDGDRLLRRTIPAPFLREGTAKPTLLWALGSGPAVGSRGGRTGRCCRPRGVLDAVMGPAASDR